MRLQSPLVFHILCILTLESFLPQVKEWDENGVGRWKTFKRQKREWIKFAAACREGEDNSKRNPIAKVRSDCEETQPIVYRITGQGIDESPIGVFIINSRTGEINITKIVDRELTPVFVILCHAENAATGLAVEKPLELRVRVLDVNDNIPIFSQTIYEGAIEEGGMENTLVMKLVATDADEPNNLNSKIAYKIESQEPAGAPMFILNKQNGELHIANILDREQHSSFSLIVKATDRDGGSDGISSQCTCGVKVIDVNDNFPTLGQSSYSASISENTLSSEMFRIQAIDADEEFTDNWKAVFFFISGNEGGFFDIVTDPATNQGIVRCIKKLDYEQMQSVPLSIGVRNVAAFHHSVSSQYQVIEGPAFSPSSISFSASESLTKQSISTYIVGTYQAIDMDTGRPATNVRYIMGRDPDALFIINPNNAEIRFTKIIDRESHYVINGVYTAEVLAISRDFPQRTSTGTILLTIQDANDNCPLVTNEIRKVCMNTPSVVIIAKDLDADPHGPPFKFVIVSQPRNHLWDIRYVNVCQTPFLHRHGWGWGRVRVCHVDHAHTSRGASASLSLPDQSETESGTKLFFKMHYLLFLSPLVIPILMSRSDCCGNCLGAGTKHGVGAGFETVPECTEGNIHSWGIEGAQPEDRVNIYTNTYGGGGMVTSGGVEEITGLGTVKGYGTAGGYGTAAGYGTTGRKESIGGTIKEYREGGVNMAFLDSYFSEKAFAYADEDEGRPANDCLLIYDHEGLDSPVGSIGCCSFIGDDLDDTYLDTLGPKFKTLAEICLGREIEPIPDVNLPWPTTVVTENTYTTGSTLQPAMPIPDPVLQGNVIVTETYTTSGSPLKPPTRNVDPLYSPNVVVTERVVAPASVTGLHGMLEIPDLPDGSNVVVTERVIAPSSRIPPSLSIPDLADASNVVVTERVIRPASGLQSNFGIPSELSNAHNVVVTERVLSGPGMSGIGGVSSMGGMSSIGGMSSMGGIGGMGGMSGMGGIGGMGGMSGMGGIGGMGGMSSMTGQMLNSDNLLSQAVGSASPGTSRRRVTKYSTVQYSNQ
uniref:Desmoglein 1 n=1 Tax=Sphenodon punctatus TaxID=8508 RepID=A0A8D0L7P6_SPHPU